MGRPAIDHTGERHGMYTVIERDYSAPSGSGQNAMWRCRCDCGREFTRSSAELRKLKSCGCLLRTMHQTHGGTGTRLYNVWISMLRRCKNPKDKTWSCYGGRGITVCKEWEDFETFREWAISAGYDKNAPRGKTTLDRIDNSKGYRPDNCRIVSQKVQCNNTRRNRRITWRGETKTLAEWSDELGIAYSCLTYRYERGEQGDRLFRPSRKQKA